ncbi:MAG: NAD(+) diphosphatase [Gammaproteobacteria bacterium]|nr:NAD(+) diphosphatase [Gammaproteobacteria bacterium]MDH5276290.1 NAD(+) diphosphatase [Gammaproteobacteria bacterium]
MNRVTFTGSGVERFAELRQQPTALAAAFAEPGARFVPIWQSRCLLRDGGIAVCQREEIGVLLRDHEAAVFLGRRAGCALFAVEIRGDTPPADLPADSFRGLREVVGEVSAADAALLAYARAMILWQERHRHCGVCGAPNRATEGGFVMACTREGCDHKSFPRIDPAIIVLVHRDEHCLLGRQSTWPEGRFSTIAGFVEPGESLEDAVAREVHEETNIRVGECRYIASQPWPFPSAMMLGFHAEARSEDIRFNDGELIEARWLTRQEIRAGAVRLPPRESIAFQLIEHWFDSDKGKPLASLGFDSPMFRRPASPADYRK